MRWLDLERQGAWGPVVQYCWRALVVEPQMGLLQGWLGSLQVLLSSLQACWMPVKRDREDCCWTFYWALPSGGVRFIANAANSLLIHL